MVRLAIHRQGWGPESLSAEDAMNMSKGYISRVLNGEKPLTIPFLLCLPADVQEAVVAAWAQRKGLIVLKAISENVTLHGVVASALAKVFGRQ
jgi:hypothetical protein